MTNRKEMIDPALLRPGRFEVHIEIGLPDKNGRIEIEVDLFPVVFRGPRIHPSLRDRRVTGRSGNGGVSGGVRGARPRRLGSLPFEARRDETESHDGYE